ncbi:MAG: cysteine desulfurase [Pseudomonadota bacterium]|nr:cysteine desulfurase [Pseudomonadota bacterium]
MNHPSPAGLGLDVEAIRADFPILHTQVHDRPLVYLDNAATCQKPRAVIESERHYYETLNANIHRGVHLLSQRATDAYEASREAVRALLNAPATQDIIFTRGTTEAINLVAQSWGRSTLRPGDEILVTHMEHHSNIVPWQLLCEQTGAVLKVVPIDERGVLELDALDSLLTSRTRLFAMTHVSNALGTVNPVAELVARARQVGALTLVDGAQAIAHVAVDVQAIDCDFYAFSAHKLYGPTGVGVLYGRRELLEQMPPWQGGGDMIALVRFSGSRWNHLPYKFEAGTPNIAGGVALKAAIDYVRTLGIDAIAAYEAGLLDYASQRARDFPGLRVVGEAPGKAAILSFVLEGIHPHDIGTILDMEGVAIRTGHHCAMPVMERYGIPATARASFAFYNTRAEVDALFTALAKVQKLFRG